MELYSALEQPATGNHCGSCRSCCSAAGLSKQNVTDLELALLGPAGPDFARYAAREKDACGRFVFEVCPNLGPEGCRVYSIRPFSCRVFGHYRAEGTVLPEACVYIGRDREFPASQYYQTVPGAVRLRQLSRDYQLRKVPTTRAASGEITGLGLNLEDVWDRALEAIGRGASPELPEQAAEEGVFATYVRALWAGENNRHAEALGYYLQVLQDCPKRHDLMTFAGFHAFQIGQMEQAEQLWLSALQLFAGNPLTFSFLGYLYSHYQQWQMAADFFGAAAELEPEQLLHRKRRDEALNRVAKRRPEASVTDHPGD